MYVVQGALFVRVVATAELGHVALEVLRAPSVLDADLAPLHVSPEALDAVGVGGGRFL